MKKYECDCGNVTVSPQDICSDCGERSWTCIGEVEIEKLFVPKQEVISIEDYYGERYSFVKPRFPCELLKVAKKYTNGQLQYTTIIAHVVDEYGTDFAIAYGKEGNLFDGREGLQKFELTKYKG